MAMILNANIKEVSVQAFGNWFTFKPGQRKAMDAKIVDFLAMQKKDMGFVSLPDICSEDPTSPDAVAAVEAATKQGRANVVAYCERMISNLEVSLQKDYDMANIKTNVTRIEGEGHLPHYELLAEFKALAQKDQDAVFERINKLKGVNGDSVKPDTSPTPKRD